MKFKVSSSVKDKVINIELVPVPARVLQTKIKMTQPKENLKINIKDFENTYEYLKLSSNVKNGVFYAQNKTVYLYDFTPRQIEELINSGVKIETSSESVNNNNLRYVNLPQPEILPVTLPYNKIDADVFYKLNSFMTYLHNNVKNENLRIILNNIELVDDRLLITSGYRDNLYQQWIRNVNGGRGDPHTGKRNTTKYPPNVRIQGVAQVGSSEHNKSNAVDIKYKSGKYSESLADLKVAVDMILLLKKFGFKGFGFYSSSHIHVDTRQTYAFWFQLKSGQKFNKIPPNMIYNNSEISSINEFKRHVLGLLKQD